MSGWAEKILDIDLTTGSIKTYPLDMEKMRLFLGGRGLGARLLWDLVGPGVDPLSPENVLIFTNGPLTATGYQTSNRFSVSTKSPLTGTVLDANSGGFWGMQFRKTGHAALIVRGKAEHPVWIEILQDQVTIHDAKELWGMRVLAVTEKLGQKKNKRNVLTIGPAGETLCRIAAIMNDGERALARGGPGAVMGSKNLKAVAVRGTGKVPLYAPEEFKAITNQVLALYKEDFPAQSLRAYGTAGYMNLSHMLGDLPIRYFQLGEYPPSDDLSGVDLADKYLKRNTACHKCVIACGRETQSPTYNDPKVDGPEYETVGALGSLLMIFDLEAVIHAGHLCNLYGMDIISMGVTIGLACELFERGLLTSADTGGLEIRYGDPEMVFRLIELTTRRQGFGAVLAEGNAALADRAGVPELSATVNRLELPMHEPRAYLGMAVTYALSPRGACHMEGDMFSLDLGQSNVEEVGLVPGERHDNTAGKGRSAARMQAWRNLYNSLPLCQFENPGVQPLLAAINAATGWDLAADDLMALGKRIVNIKRLLNFKLGMTKANDRLPELLLKPLKEGGAAGIVPDMPALLAGAYAEFGWDAETGRPPEELAF
jgi:aldehyde:ferredoxin oxidoreductase